LARGGPARAPTRPVDDRSERDVVERDLTGLRDVPARLLPPK